MDHINLDLQAKLAKAKQESIELKAKYEVEIQDYKNVISNLEMKFTGLSQNSNISVVFFVFNFNNLFYFLRN